MISRRRETPPECPLSCPYDPPRVGVLAANVWAARQQQALSNRATAAQAPSHDSYRDRASGPQPGSSPPLMASQPTGYAQPPQGERWGQPARRGSFQDARRERGSSGGDYGKTTHFRSTANPHNPSDTFRLPYTLLDLSADAGGYGGYQQPPSRTGGGYYDRRGPRPGSPEPAGGCAEWGSRWGERGPRAPDGAGVRDRQPPASAPSDAPAYGRGASW